MLKFELFEKSVSWSAPNKNGKFFFNPKHKEKLNAIKKIRELYNGHPIDDYVIVEFQFQFEPPKSASKKKRAQMLTGEIFPTKSDCTNMQKFYEDCLKGVVIVDDRNVIQVTSTKFYAEKEKVVIKLFTLTELIEGAIDHAFKKG